MRADHLARHRVLRRLVDPDLAHPGAGLEEEVVQEVELQVAGVEDVLPRPGLPGGPARDRAHAEVEEVVGVARHAGKVEGRYYAVGACLGLVEQQVDGVGDELDVAHLLSGDVGDEVVVGADLALAPHVERLVGVVHEGAHLAELAAHELLHDARGLGVSLLRPRQLYL